MKNKRKKQIAKLSISQIKKLERQYNAVNKTFYHYGQIVHIAESSNVDRCVCCGDIVPEDRLVCPKCEKEAERGQ